MLSPQWNQISPTKHVLKMKETLCSNGTTLRPLEHRSQLAFTNFRHNMISNLQLLHGPAPDRGISFLLRLAILVLGFVALFMLSFTIGAFRNWAPPNDHFQIFDPLILVAVSTASFTNRQLSAKHSRSSPPTSGSPASGSDRLTTSLAFTQDDLLQAISAAGCRYLAARFLHCFSHHC